MDEDLKIGSIIKKLFGLEQKELILLLFFLAIFIFCIYSLIVILVEEKNLLKQLEKYKIIEKHKQEIFLILILPIIFLIIVCFGLIELESWLGFFGGYFGVLGAVVAVYLQSYEEKKKKLENATLYIKFILEFNYKRNFENNIQFELIKIFTLEGEIISISDEYNHFLNFNENEIQNNISSYIELGILEKIYELISLIKCFTYHYNYWYKNSNDFYSKILSLEKKLNLKQKNLQLKFKYIYNIVKEFSKINETYNSIEYGEFYKSKLYFFKSKKNNLESNYNELKKFASYYEYNKIDNSIQLLEKINKEIKKNRLTNIRLDSKISSQFFESYKESLEVLFIFLKDYKLLDSKELKYYELMYYTMEITYNTFHSLKEKIEELKKSLF